MCLSCNPGLAAILQHAASRRDFLKYVGVASTSAFAATAVEPAVAMGRFFKAETPADVIFQGGTVLTMKADAPRAEAVAIRDGRIVALGTASEISAYKGPDTRIVDLDERTLMPGMIDPHMHSVFVVLTDWIDVSPITTPAFDDIWNKLREGVARAREGEWVRAKQFDPSITANARIPTLADLDMLAPNNPFFMLESNGHIAYVNSKAMELVGISQLSQDPPQGRFDHDANGQLSGRLEEAAAFTPFIAKMPLPNAAEIQTLIRNMMDDAASKGCTALHDCGIGMMSGGGDIALLDAVMAQNPPVRYRGMLISTIMEQWEKLVIKPGHGNDSFRIDGMKAWADGSNQAMTGYQRENYLGTDQRGALNYTPEQLTNALRIAHNAGWQVAVHANGDAAIDTTIAAYETVLREKPRNDHRHRIEHCSVLHPAQMVKMKELGLSPSFLIGHVRWWGKAFRDRILGPERAKFYDPCASALAAGLRISFHSDWNVTPIEPLRYVEDAVTRIMNEGGDVFFANERIGVDAALKAVTLDAAWQCRMDNICGSLEPGKYADMTILEQDPTSVASTDIKAIKVSETWIAGEKRFGA